MCGDEMQPVGKEFVRDELVYVPAKLFVRKHYVEVLKCPVCGTDESKDALLPDVPAPVLWKAEAPAPLIPHSFCSPELLAHILFQKYCQAVPLYRQEKEFKALSVDLSRKFAKAVQYAKNEKQYLYRFLEDPDIPIHNNRAENAIRPFVVGRKNWLFSDTVKGAEASAVFYSLAATATANGISVEQYFTKLLSHPTELPMPWN